MAPALPDPCSSCPEAVVTLRATRHPPSVPASTQADLHEHESSLQLLHISKLTCWAAILRAQSIASVDLVCGLNEGEGWPRPVASCVHRQTPAMLAVTLGSCSHQGDPSARGVGLWARHCCRLWYTQDAGQHQPGRPALDDLSGGEALPVSVFILLQMLLTGPDACVPVNGSSAQDGVAARDAVHHGCQGQAPQLHISLLQAKFMVTTLRTYKTGSRLGLHGWTAQAASSVGGTVYRQELP